ncbi:hypothetical protein CkaCkLH20_11629 [Colletotrichum karsti]|uniref:D-xylose 1-dehydrogenase (NADP(+), D-xylono-1,5-lactone-forming) n=1 Tax=Colletotrichum karsti TaxID=1095194 RepID=A0A9P6HTZ1_9PEZI|nr:uncharacterized protein CkaCkLH20_11629 [Colletotrichum karsti]KAF9870957.1 hypothetical protein CkaCkLH20_11629 [Colletotrichum karsti]
MTSTKPHTLRWGIMATGHIARSNLPSPFRPIYTQCSYNTDFVRDLVTDPSIRDADDVRHSITAVASSTSTQKAVDFCTEVQIPEKGKVRTYGSYRELVVDPDVDIIYVATPLSHHFQNAMLALEAGKHVLCEKSFTITSAQAKKLVEIARQRRLFLMEALWTRFFPLSIKIRELVSTGTIGTVYRVIADNSINRSLLDGKLDFDDSNRMVNPQLAGGAMLDLGVYSLSWIMQILYHLQPENEKESPAVMAAMNKYHTGTDETTSFIVQFPRHNTMGIGMTTLRLGSGVDYDFTGGPAIKMQGSDGELQVCGPAFRPHSYKIIRKGGGGEVETVEFPFPQDSARGGWGRGLYWEADECARCLRDGRLESDVLPLDETIVSMEVMEEVLRQGGISFPSLITSDSFDPQSPLNNGR